MRLKQVLTGATLLTGVGVGLVEARYRRHPGNDLSFGHEGWAAERTGPDRLQLGGRVVLHNEVAAREVMVADARAEVRLLSRSSTDGLRVEARVSSGDPRYPPRPDGYWVAFAVKPGRYGEDSALDVAAQVSGPGDALDDVYAAWIELHLTTYGFEAYREQRHHVVLPIEYPDPADDPGRWRDVAGLGASVRPIRTHLLSALDDPVDVVRRYAVPHAAPGDIVTICESPVAVMQGRFFDPRQWRPGWAATRLAQFMSGVGSLGTRGGMQALINDAGTPRVLAALVGGTLGKAARQDGWFYRLAGPQARLIDDLPENIPPYDRFIVGGPLDGDGVCARITAATGLAAAVVDANNLGLVDVVGRSRGVSDELVIEALRSNPAGNADESTPVVLVRPTRT